MKKFLLLIFLFIAFTLQCFSQWTVDTLPSSRMWVQAVGWQNKVYFIGGLGLSTSSLYYYYYYTTAAPLKEVAIYNCDSSRWEPSDSLSTPRFGIACVAGDSGFYALGGTDDSDVYPIGTNVVDIYKNGVFHADTIPGHVFFGNGVKAGHKIIFGGFADTINQYTSEIFATDKVFIYDELTGTWSTSALSTPRSLVAAAANDSLAIFAGGANGLCVASDVVDIYHVNSGTWSTAHLSSPRMWVKGIYHNGKFYFAGGCGDGLINYSSDVVDVFDGSNWSTLNLSQARSNMAIAAFEDLVFFIGGGDEDMSLFAATNTYNTVDVLNTSTGEWSRNDMGIGIEGAAYAVAGDKIVVGSGRTNYGGYYGYSQFASSTWYVEILDVSGLTGAPVINSEVGFNAFPNPSNGKFMVSLPAVEGEIYVTDILGHEIMRTQVREKYLRLQLDDAGAYIIYLRTKEGVTSQKLFVVK